MRENPLTRAAVTIMGALLTTVALAGSASAKNEERKASLYVLTRSECVEDYAAELNAAGIEVELSAFDTLASIARFLKVPGNVPVRHILFIRGYAIVNHVAPDQVADLLGTMPRVKGLVGTTECGTRDTHAATHTRDVTTF